MKTFAALRSTARADPRRNARVAATATTRTAGPQDDAPSYSDIDNAPWNKQITALFRQRMIAKIGEDTEEQGYDGIIALTRKLNSMYKGTWLNPSLHPAGTYCRSLALRSLAYWLISLAHRHRILRPYCTHTHSETAGSCADPKQTQEATVEILLTLFPSWLPQFFSVLFAKPFPEFSNKMNAWVTALTCQWLMGPNQVVDYERPDGSVAVAQAVQVERCDSVMWTAIRSPRRRLKGAVDTTFLRSQTSSYGIRYQWGRLPSALI